MCVCVWVTVFVVGKRRGKSRLGPEKEPEQKERLPSRGGAVLYRLSPQLGED